MPIQFQRYQPALFLLILSLGTVIRSWYIFIAHDPRQYVYSDMASYLGNAQSLADGEGFVPGSPYHTTPGLVWLLGLSYKLDPSLALALIFQLIASCAVLPLIYYLSKRVFDNQAALLSLAIAVFYFPFVDYGGFFLTEIYLAALIPAALLALFLSLSCAGTSNRITLSLLSGIVAGVALSFKAYIIPSFGILLLFSLLFGDRPIRNRIQITFAATAGFLLMGSASIYHCTVNINDGKFCLGRNIESANLIVGHYGNWGLYTWKGMPDERTFSFGSPAAYQRGRREQVVLQHSITDSTRNYHTVVRWIVKHPFGFLKNIAEHIADTFFWSYPWPAEGTLSWVRINHMFHYFYLIILLIPSFLLLFKTFNRDGVRRALQREEVLLFSPVLGLALAVSVGSGEARYRMPFDTIFVVLAGPVLKQMLFQTYSLFKKSKKAVDPECF